MAALRRNDNLVRSQIVPLALRLLAPKDPGVLPVFQRFGVEEDAPYVELPIERVHALLDELALATEDPLLGHHLSHWRPEGSHGIVEYFWRSAVSVEQAAQEVARASGLFNDTAEWIWKRRPRSGVLAQRVPANLVGMGRHANEFVVTTILGEIEKLTGKPARPIRVMYEHTRGAAGVDYEALHGAARVEFGNGMTGVELDEETLARRIITSSPALLDTLRQEAMKGIGAVAATAPPGSMEKTPMLSRISELVRLGLHDGVPTLATIAVTMSTSARSLQRRLEEQGTSLRELIERVRMAEAERRLLAEEVEVATLARELGFVDPSAFGRAFKRCSGVSPTDFRAKRRKPRR